MRKGSVTMNKQQIQNYINANVHKIADVEINHSSMYLNFINGDTVIVSQGDFNMMDFSFEKGEE